MKECQTRANRGHSREVYPRRLHHRLVGVLVLLLVRVFNADSSALPQDILNEVRPVLRGKGGVRSVALWLRRRENLDIHKEGPYFVR